MGGRPLEQTREPRSPALVFNPRSVAIVGASERARWPSKIHGNLMDAGFAGDVFPINPKRDSVWGKPCWPDFRSLPKVPDHALFILPAPAALDMLEEGAAAGLKAATIYAGGIGEGSDPDVIRRGERLRAVVDRYGITIAGPNCMGSMAFRERYFIYPNRDLCDLPVGPTAAVFQSGGTLQFWATTAASRGVKFSYLVSSGNEIGLDLADYIEHFTDDPGVGVIVLFIEGVRRPRAFMQAAARALKAGKPIVAIKTGRHEKSREAARSHTGAVGGDYASFCAMCERFGIVVCDDLDDMVETVLALQAGRRPGGRRLGVFTTSGGTVDLLYDCVDDMGDRVLMPDFAESTKEKIRPLLPPDIDVKNPLDAGIPSDDATAAAICEAIAHDPNVDALAWAAQLPSGSKGMRDVSAIRRVVEGTDRPVIGFGRMRYPLGPDALALQDAFGFPFLQGLGPTLRAFDAAAFHAERVARDPALAPPRPEASGPMPLAALERALSAHGLTPPSGGFAADATAAADLAERTGWPVALKLVSPGVSHKTEVGGVRLGLRSRSEVLAAAADMAAALDRIAPDAGLDGFLVQEMVSGVEALVGVREDPLYGPMLTVGAGGVLVELTRDVSHRLLPVSRDDVRAMLGELRLGRLLAGFRGAPPADMAALVDAAVGLGTVFLEHRDALAEVEINPLVVLPEGRGARMVDLRPVFRDPVEP